MPTRVKDQTLRQIVHTSIGGSHVRVAFTNRYGTEALEIGAAHIALRDVDAAIVAGSGRPLTFDGKRSGAIEAGSTLLSDPVDLAVPPLVDVAVDLYLPGDTWATTSPATYHMAGLTTNYLSPSGDHTGVTALPVEATLPSWFFLSRVDVNTDTAPGAIVLFGDSITDGTASTPDTNSRWPDVLAKRLVEAWGDAAPGVLNVGLPATASSVTTWEWRGSGQVAAAQTLLLRTRTRSLAHVPRRDWTAMSCCSRVSPMSSCLNRSTTSACRSVARVPASTTLWLDIGR